MLDVLRSKSLFEGACEILETPPMPKEAPNCRSRRVEGAALQRAVHVLLSVRGPLILVSIGAPGTVA